MFTGLVREIGTVLALERDDAGARVRMRAELAAQLELGDSVAVAGACLTVSELEGETFAADVSNQTLSVTTLGALDAGAGVNLEPALRVGEPLGGHLVQGHVDGVGEVAAVSDDGDSRRVAVVLPDDLARYVVERGSVTLDGVSLTVAGLEGARIEAVLIPETLARSTLGAAAPGDRVNVEVDVVGRYVERLLPEFRGAPDR